MFSTWFWLEYASEEEKSLSQEVCPNPDLFWIMACWRMGLVFYEMVLLWDVDVMAVSNALKHIFRIDVAVKKEAYFHTASRSRLEILLLYIGDVFWLHQSIPWPWKPGRRHFLCFSRCFSFKDMTSFWFSRNGGIITRSIQDARLSAKKIKL